SANASESYSANQITKCVFTQSRPGPDLRMPSHPLSGQFLSPTVARVHSERRRYTSTPCHQIVVVISGHWQPPLPCCKMSIFGTEELDHEHKQHQLAWSAGGRVRHRNGA